LEQLAATTRNSFVGRKSLAETGEFVGSTDSITQRLTEDCAADDADRDAEPLLEQYRGMPAPPAKPFFSLLHHPQPEETWLRAGLFELWMRAAPKPKGGDISGMCMDDELPVLHWLLREQVREVFEVVTESRPYELREFVAWFMNKSRSHTEYFSGNYEYSSFNEYTYGRPRHAAWVRLAQEVQNAAAILGISFPKRARLPALPTLEEPTK
jgi:hypothetical protein